VVKIKDRIKTNISPSTMGLFDVIAESRDGKDIIHNDFSNEIPPKFELFSDRLEITSAGAIPAGFDEEEFFMGSNYLSFHSQLYSADISLCRWL